MDGSRECSVPALDELRGMAGPVGGEYAKPVADESSGSDIGVDAEGCIGPGGTVPFSHPADMGGVAKGILGLGLSAGSARGGGRTRCR